MMSGQDARNRDRLVLSNAYLERVIEIEDGVVHTTALASKLADRSIGPDSEEFRVALLSGPVLTNADLRVTGHKVQTTDTNGARLVVGIASPRHGIEGEIVYVLEPGDFYTRKVLHLRAVGQGESLQLDWVDVESFRAEGATELGGRGQPVFIGDTFFAGLEYPAGHNVVAEGRIALKHYPNATLSSEDWVSKTAVLGVAPAGQVRPWFLRYIERIRRKRRPFLSFNTGGDLQIYSPVQTPDPDATVMDCVSRVLEAVRTNVCEKCDIPLHSFVLDAGWQDPQTLYGVDETKFPGGFPVLNQQLAAAGSGLGLWLSPTTLLSKTQLDLEFVAREGYEIVSSGRYPCLSGTRYYPAIREIVRRHIVENGVRYFKFDFNYFECLSPNHNHLPDSGHSIEANLDAHLELLHMAASLREDLVMVPTCGMWLSPWWLMHADAIWPHTMWDFNYDRNVVALRPRQWEQTCRDENLHQLLRVEQCQFPFSGITSCWCAGGPRYNIAGPFETLQDRLDDAVHAITRQLRLAEKTIPSPITMLDEEGDYIVALLRWAFYHTERVPDCTMILGQPTKGEVYGFSYLGENGGVILLRNPSMHRQTVRVPLESLACHDRFWVEATYPYRQLLSPEAGADVDCRIEVGPYEVVVVEAAPTSSLRWPTLAGCQHSVVQHKPGELILDAWTEPGQVTTLQLLSPTDLLGVFVDSEQVARVGGRALELTISAKGTPHVVRTDHLPPVKDQDGVERQMVRVDVPDSLETKVLLLSEGSRLRTPRLSVNMGGWFGGLPFETVVGNGWTAYWIRIDPRELNVIGWGFAPDPDGTPEPRSSLWLFNERQLVPSRVTVRYAPAVAEAAPLLPTPFAGLRREVLRLDPRSGAERVAGLPWTDEYAGALP